MRVLEHHLDPRISDLIHWPGEYFGDGDNSRELSPQDILDIALKLQAVAFHPPHNMVFTLGLGFVIGESFGLPRAIAPLSRFGLQRRGHRLFGNVNSFLVNCFVMRRFLASVRSGVVKSFRCRALAECLSSTDGQLRQLPHARHQTSLQTRRLLGLACLLRCRNAQGLRASSTLQRVVTRS